MKLKYGQLLGAVPVLQKLVAQPLHLKQAYQLSKIAKKADEELAFFRSKHEAIMNSGDKEAEKIKMVNELLSFEIDWSIDPLVLSVNDNIELSAQDLANSEGLIEISE